MPSRWLIWLNGPQDAPIPSTAPFAVVSGWLDDHPTLSRTTPGGGAEHRSAHDASSRAWSLTPPSTDNTGRTVLEVGLLDDSLTDRLRDSTRPGTSVRLGHHHYRVARPPRQVAHIGWDDLRRRWGERAWQIGFRTPTTFRSGKRTSPWPDPVTVARGLSARWAGLRPDDVVPRPAPGSVWVSDIDGHSVTIPLRGTVVSGFVGRLRYVCDGSEEDAAAFHALLALAEYAGVGSHTTVGLGVIRPEPTWQPGRNRREAVSGDRIDAPETRSEQREHVRVDVVRLPHDTIEVGP